MAIEKEQIQLEVTVNGKQAGTSLGDLQKRYRGLNAEIRHLTPGTDAFIKKSAELRQVRTKMNEVKDSIFGARKAMNGIAQSAKGFIGAYLGMAGVQRAWSFLVTEAIDKMDQQAKAEKSLEVAIGFHSKALLEQASAIQAVTTFGDESIIQGQAMLAQYKLTEAQILRLTPAMVDFAASQGINVVDAAKLLSKTLGSSTNAMSRYGIEVNGAAGSNERLSSLIEGLDQKFSGQAEATMAGAGTLQQFSNTLGDIQEKIGSVVLKGFTPFIRLFSFAAKAVDGWLAPTEKAKTRLEQLNDTFNDNIAVLKRGEIPQKERLKLIEQLNTMYGPLLENQLTETSTLAEIEQAQKDVNDQFQRHILLKANEEKLAEIAKKITEAEKAMLQVRIDQAIAEEDWIKGNENAAESLQAYQLKQQLANDALSINKGVAETATREQEKLKAAYDDLASTLNLDFFDALEKSNIKTEEATKKTKEFHVAAVTMAKDAFGTELKQFSTPEDYEADLKRQEDAAKKELDLANRTSLAKAQLKIVASADNNALLLEMLVAKLELERDIELQNLELTEEEKQLIIAESQQKTDQLREEYAAKDVERNKRVNAELLSTAQMALDAIGQFHQIKTDKVVAEAERGKDATVKTLDRQLKNEMITRAEYDKRREAAEAKFDTTARAAKRKQAILDKEIGIIQSVINTAIAVGRALGTPPAPNIPLSILAGVQGAIQTSLIAAQPIPAFAGGGITISDGGMINGRHIGEFGERGPEWVAPNWMLHEPVYANMIGMLENARRAKMPAFAAGGLTGDALAPSPGVGSMNQSLVNAIDALVARLDQPILSVTHWDQFASTRDLIEEIESNNSLND